MPHAEVIIYSIHKATESPEGIVLPTPREEKGRGISCSLGWIICKIGHKEAPGAGCLSRGILWSYTQHFSSDKLWLSEEIPVFLLDLSVVRGQRGPYTCTNVPWSPWVLYNRTNSSATHSHGTMLLEEKPMLPKSESFVICFPTVITNPGFLPVRTDERNQGRTHRRSHILAYGVATGGSLLRKAYFQHNKRCL